MEIRYEIAAFAFGGFAMTFSYIVVFFVNEKYDCSVKVQIIVCHSRETCPEQGRRSGNPNLLIVLDSASKPALSEAEWVRNDSPQNTIDKAILFCHVYLGCVVFVLHRRSGDGETTSKETCG